MRPTIGVIGGMGNEAMADLAGNLADLPESNQCNFVFYGNSRLAFTPREADEEWNECDDPIVRKHETGRFTAAVLQNCGAVRACLACNDEHSRFREIFAELDVDFVDMIAETGSSAAIDGGVLVLGTKRILNERLYEDSLEATGIEPFQPTAENRSRLMNAIYDPGYGIKSGTVTERAKELISDILREECDRHPTIDTVVLGCTELPLALNTNTIHRLTDSGKIPSHLKFIDPTQVLAEALVADYPERTQISKVSLTAFRGEHLDYHPPFTCRVDSLTMMEEFQSRLINWTIDYFQERDTNVGGSYMHLPTLFFVDHDEPVRLDTDELDITVHEYSTVPGEPDKDIENALCNNYENLSHLI